MAKNKPTVIQGYIQGAPHVIKFLEKEIGSEEVYEREVAKARKAYAKEMERLKAEKAEKAENGEELDDDSVVIDDENKVGRKLGDRMQAIKAGYHRVYAPMRIHGEKMAALFGDKKSTDKKVIDKEILEDLIYTTYSNQNNNIFTLESADWMNKAGAKAMKKFTDMMFNNDLKKYQYYQNCLEKGTFAGTTLKEVLKRPLPMVRKPEKNDREDLKRKIQELSQKLKNADSALHVNSSEFKEMTASVKSVGEALWGNMTDDELGKRLEVMQAASMKYVHAKGVGLQSSQLGKDRMDAALDICGTATEYMDCYASKERIQEVLEYEQKTVGKVISKNGTFDYRLNLEMEARAMDVNDDDEIENNQNGIINEVSNNKEDLELVNDNDGMMF